VESDIVRAVRRGYDAFNRGDFDAGGFAEALTPLWGVQSFTRWSRATISTAD
jgi:hypothetical protein